MSESDLIQICPSKNIVQYVIGRTVAKKKEFTEVNSVMNLFPLTGDKKIFSAPGLMFVFRVGSETDSGNRHSGKCRSSSGPSIFLPKLDEIVSEVCSAASTHSEDFDIHLGFGDILLCGND